MEGKDTMSDTQLFSGLEVLLAAIEIEKSGHKFYSEMAKHFEQNSARTIFTDLARDEVEHLRTLMELLSSYQEGSFWEEEQEYLPYLRRFHEAEVFPAQSQIEAALETSAPEEQVLKLAIQAEQRFAEYFTIAAKHAKTRDGKTTFGWLANEEKQHAELLTERQKQLTSGTSSSGSM
jgi:rubrerythrin